MVVWTSQVNRQKGRVPSHIVPRRYSTTPRGDARGPRNTCTTGRHGLTVVCRVGPSPSDTTVEKGILKGISDTDEDSLLPSTGLSLCLGEVSASPCRSAMSTGRSSSSTSEKSSSRRLPCLTDDAGGPHWAIDEDGTTAPFCGGLC